MTCSATVKILLCFVSLATMDIVICKSLSGQQGALVGLAFSHDGLYLNLAKVDPETLAPSIIEVNISLFSGQGVAPEYLTAYCPNNGLYLIGINGNFAPRVVAVDLKAGYKVVGAINLRGFSIDNLECDGKTGLGIAYVLVSLAYHQLIQLDFSSFSAKLLMATSHMAYGGSAIDPVNGRVFTVAVLPKFDSFNYSLTIMEYRASKEILTAAFPHFSIGGMVFDPKIGQPVAVVQTPPQEGSGPQYLAFLAALDISKGLVEPLVKSWPGQYMIKNTGVTMDPVSRIVYVFVEDYVRAISIDKGTVLYMKPTKALPQPKLNYRWVA